MRKKARDKGALKTTEQQKVETKVVESKTVIIIEQANPQVVYVPTYNPTVVYGPPVYPYPPVVYPPPAPSGRLRGDDGDRFRCRDGGGIRISRGWGYGCGWGHNDVNINVNNNCVNNYNKQNSNNQVGSNSSNWQHTSKFLNQLFPGIDSFSGTLSISAPGLIGALALRQDQAVCGRDSGKSSARRLDQQIRSAFVGVCPRAKSVPINSSRTIQVNGPF